MNQQIFNYKTDEKPLDNIKENCGFAAIFKDIGVIGDSLSSGEFEATDENGQTTYHDFYEYSWPAILERLTGTRYSNYSRGGMSLKEFYESWADKNNFWQKKQAYIIDLGNNDIYLYKQQIGTVKDINVDKPCLNPDTYFGYLLLLGLYCFFYAFMVAISYWLCYWRIYGMLLGSRRYYWINYVF